LGCNARKIPFTAADMPNVDLTGSPRNYLRFCELDEADELMLFDELFCVSELSAAERNHGGRTLLNEAEPRPRLVAAPFY
jgi:hypothetical protein